MSITVYCSKCNKKIGVVLKLKRAPLMVCTNCTLKEAAPVSSSKEELAEMRKHFANNPGVLKLIDEQEERNRLIEHLDYLDKVEYDAEQQSNKDFYEALGVEDPDLPKEGE